MAGRIAAPAADAARVAAIRNNLNINDRGAVAGFGEQARKALQAAGERLMAEVRGGEAKGAADRLRAAQERIEKLDPTELEPRGGLDGIFNGRVARLHRFRRSYEHAAHALADITADLEARTKKIAARSEALNGLHEGARALILEVDAWLEAGRARLAEARAAMPASAAPDTAESAEAAPRPDMGPADRLAARLADLDRARSAALQRLPLVRVVQNADAFLSDDLTRAKAAMAEWRAAWGELLGVGRGDLGDRVRPHIPALAESKLAAVEALGRAIKGVAGGAVRRTEAEARMEKATKG